MKNPLLKKILIFSVFTILIGAIYIYPDIRFIIGEGENFKGITLTATNDEAFYLAKLNGVYKGDYRLANVSIYEHRNDLWLVPPYFMVGIGLIGKAFNIPVPYLDIILSFLFPIIIFWLIYLLVFHLSGSWKLGILAACSILLGYAAFTTHYHIFKDVILFKFSQSLWFLRPYSPQLTYTPFVLSLLLIYLFIDTHRISTLFLVALSIASLNYIHLHLWAFLFSGLAAWLVFSILQKDSLIRKNIIIILVSSLFLGIPYWINHYKVSLSPNYAYLNEMFGTEYSHRSIIPIAHILLSSIIVLLNRKSSPKSFYFLLMFLVAGLLCLNQQIITGEIMGPIYFLTYTNKTFIILGLVVSLNKIRLPNSILKKFSDDFKAYVLRGAFIVSIVALFSLALAQQNNYYNKNKKTFSKIQSMRGAFDWLNHNTEKEDVVLTDSLEFGSFLFLRTFTMYTKNYYYLNVESTSLISKEERGARFLYAMRFFRYSPKEVESILNYGDGVIIFGLSTCYGLAEDVDEYILKLIDRYKELTNEDPISLINHYKVDYIFLGRKDHLFDTFENRYPKFSKVYDDGNYKIYKF